MDAEGLHHLEIFCIGHFCSTPFINNMYSILFLLVWVPDSCARLLVMLQHRGVWCSGHTCLAAVSSFHQLLFPLTYSIFVGLRSWCYFLTLWSLNSVLSPLFIVSFLVSAISSKIPGSLHLRMVLKIYMCSEENAGKYMQLLQPMYTFLSIKISMWNFMYAY